MIDPEARAERLALEAADPEVGVLLLDVVLGYASHPDPAGVLAPRSARPWPPARSSPSWATCSAPRPTRRCAAARRPHWPRPGVRLAPTNAAAARLAAATRRVRIRIATYSTKPRGGVVHALHLAEALGDRGHDVELWALSADGAALLPRAARAARAWCRSSAARARTSSRASCATRPPSPRGCAPPGPADVHHSEDCLSARSLLALRAEGRVPAVVRTVHHVDDFASPVLAECQRASIEDVDHRDLRQPPLGRRARRATTGSRREVIPNGVDGGRFADCPLDRAAAGERLGWGGAADGARHRRHRAAQGQPHPARGVRARPAARSGPGALLADRRRRDALRLRRLPRRLGGGRRAARPARPPRAAPRPADADVAVLGPVPDDDMPALMRAADVFAFPSEREGFGLVVLEAQAAGVPVVVSDLPVLREFLADGRDCRMAPVGDAGALAEALVEVDGRRRRCARASWPAGRATAARFTWEAAAAAHERVYERVAPRRPVSPIDEEHEYAVWTAEWKGGLATDVSGRGHTLRVDEPDEFGGERHRPDADRDARGRGLASCFCIAVAWAARKKRIELEDLRVSVQPHRVVGEPRHGSYDVWVESSTPGRAAGARGGSGQALLLGHEHDRRPRRRSATTWASGLGSRVGSGATRARGVELGPAHLRHRRRGRGHQRGLDGQAHQPRRNRRRLHRVRGRRLLAVRHPLRARAGDPRLRAPLPRRARELRAGRHRPAPRDRRDRGRRREPDDDRQRRGRAVGHPDRLHRVELPAARRARQRPRGPDLRQEHPARRSSSTRRSTTSGRPSCSRPGRSAWRC